MFGDTNSIQNGPVSQSSEDTADSVEGTSMDETKASTYHDYNDRKVYEGIQAYSYAQLSEAQIRRIRLMNSLLMLRKHLKNYKECMISSLVYLDKLTQLDDEISSQNLNWVVLWCIWIADKLFNDSPIANRVYAFRANIQLEKFNDLEVKIMKKLNFDAQIHPEEYDDYRNELENFCNTKTADLENLYLEYKHDRSVLKQVKEDISIQQLNLKINSGYISSENNYSDPEISETMHKVSSGFFAPNHNYQADKFRFESYNSHIFKEIRTSRRTCRSRSEPSLSTNLENLSGM